MGGRYDTDWQRTNRDSWLIKQPDGEQLIKRYYATAPAIVELINKQPNRCAIYRHLNVKLIFPSVCDTLKMAKILSAKSFMLIWLNFYTVSNKGGKSKFLAITVNL